MFTADAKAPARGSGKRARPISSGCPDRCPSIFPGREVRSSQGTSCFRIIQLSHLSSFLLPFASAQSHLTDWCACDCESPGDAFVTEDNR
jgi:hypothetical protein